MYHLASLFHMYKDMGERIPGEQDTPSLITEGPSQGPSNSQRYAFFKHFLAPLCHLAAELFKCRLVRRRRRRRRRRRQL